ncbi:MAG: hypothetical protein WC700_07580 [Gemmatimonadaceae bacterium]
MAKNAAALAGVMGHAEIVLCCWRLGAITKEDLDDVMACAALGGHIPVVAVCYAFGARNTERAFLSAAAWGRTRVMHWLRSIDEARITAAVDRAMAVAVRWGSRDGADMCAAWGARDYNGAMREAAHCRATRVSSSVASHASDSERPMSVSESLDWCRAHGATQFGQALVVAACTGNIEAMGVLRRWDGSAAALEEALIAAAGAGQSVAVDLCLAWGARAVEAARQHARARGHLLVEMALTDVAAEAAFAV